MSQTPYQLPDAGPTRHTLFLPPPLSPPPPIPTYPATGVILLSAFLSHISIPTPAAGLRAAGGEAEQGTRAAPPSEGRRLLARGARSPSSPSPPSPVRGADELTTRRARGTAASTASPGTRRSKSRSRGWAEAEEVHGGGSIGGAGGHVHGVAANLRPAGARRPSSASSRALVHRRSESSGGWRRVCFPPFSPLSLRASAPKVGSW
jgi:hypothetical protein